LGALAAALAVMLAAAGAHLVRGKLTADAMSVFDTALLMHMVHALGLVLAGVVAAQRPQSALVALAGWLMLAGLLLFSGSLYLYVLADLPFMRRVTPWGGVSFIAAWLALAAGVWLRPDTRP
jgi:uncharacterized membrane protein YgdD (TMEM256/DUF423 family)